MDKPFLTGGELQVLTILFGSEVFYRLLNPFLGLLRERLEQQWGVAKTKKIVGTLDFYVNCAEDVGDREWRKIAELGKGKDGVVALSQTMHCKYQGSKLISYSVAIEFVAIDQDMVRDVIYPLPIMLQLPGSNKDGVKQIVKVGNCNARKRFKDEPQNGPGYPVERNLTFHFPGGISSDSKKPARLRFTVDMKYSPEKMYETVSRDVAISANNWAIRKLVASVEFSKSCPPESNPLPRALRYSDNYVRAMGRVVNDRDDIYQSTYYGVHKQSFSYGLDWEWADEKLNYEKHKAKSSALASKDEE